MKRLFLATFALVLTSCAAYAPAAMLGAPGKGDKFVTTIERTSPCRLEVR